MGILSILRLFHHDPENPYLFEVLNEHIFYFNFVLHACLNSISQKAENYNACINNSSPLLYLL